MNARLGNNTSYIWRSLLWSKGILADGLTLRAGDVKSIQLFEDNWIPSVKSKIGTSLVQMCNGIMNRG